MREGVISLLVPSRMRVNRFNEFVSSALRLASRPEKIEICCYLDDDDKSGYEETFPEVLFNRGERKRILGSAYNKLVDISSGSILFYGSDDIVFESQGWDDVVRDRFDCFDDEVLLLGVRDTPEGQVPLHGFVSRSCVELLGRLFPPYFEHGYYDFWLGDIYSRVGRLEFVGIKIKHKHWHSFPGFRDSVYDDRSRKDEEGKTPDDRDLVKYEEMVSERDSDVSKLSNRIQMYSSRKFSFFKLGGAREIEYSGYLYDGDFSYTAYHPFYRNFVSGNTGFSFVEQCDVSHPDAVFAFSVTSGDFDSLPSRFSKYYGDLLDTCLQNGVSREGVFRFLQTRPLSLVSQMPDRLTFVPTYPFYVGPNNWFIEIEDYTTLLYPFVHNGFTKDLNIESHFCYRIMKAMLSLDNCKGVISHIESTCNTIRILFPEVAKKVFYVPIGLEMPDLSEKAPITEEKLDLLYGNSFGGRSSHFYVRGGPQALSCFKEFCGSRRNVHLTMVTPIPEKVKQDPITKHPCFSHFDHHISNKQMNKLRLACQIFLIPSFRIHILSTVQSMAYGLPVISSDGWGFSEFVKEGITGYMGKGQTHSWSDSRGILREDYGAFLPESFDASVVEAIRPLVEDVEHLRKLSKSTREYACDVFSSNRRDSILKEALEVMYG